MFRVMVNKMLDFKETIEIEYSGIHHETREAAEEELKKALENDGRFKIDLSRAHIEEV